MATFSLKAFLKEARRRRVFRVSTIYIVGAWIALQAADLAFPGLGIEESAILYVWIGAILGLPIVLFFGWRYDIIGGRIVRTSVSDVDKYLSMERTDYVILAALSVVVAVVVFGLVGEISKTRVPDAPRSTFVDIDPRSIAVLPFLNMSDDPEQEYFSDGVSEEILNLLVKVPELRVTSRSSAFSFKGQNVDMPTMAAKLRVAHVLEGSVRKSGNQLRITAQLIDVKADTHLWSQTFERELKNVFAIQDEIAAAVVDALKITLLGNQPKAAETTPKVYALYLQGRYFRIQRTAETHKRAEALLRQALEIDPSYAPAWSELGTVYAGQADPFGLRPIAEGYALGHNAIQQALKIDPQYGPAHALMAYYEMDYGWDFKAASQHVQKALATSPGDANVLADAAYVNRVFGRLDVAIDLFRQSIALDPLSPDAHYRLGRTLYEANFLDEAADTFRLALSLNRGWLGAHYRLGRVLLAQGDAPAALAAMRQETGELYRLTGTAIVQHALGDTVASEAALQEFTEKYAAVGAYQVAEIYAFRNEIDQAFDWMERAYNRRDTGLSGLLTNPLFANLHDDPRWEPLLDKMGLPH